MSMYAIFQSQNDIMKRSGDNNGFIFNPACVEFRGESFQIYPGQKLLIVLIGGCQAAEGAVSATESAQEQDNSEEV